MKDQKGVVEQLIRAVSRLQINIVSQQSYSIDYLKHHVVSMVLDWGTAEQVDGHDLEPRLMRYYADYRYIFPSGDIRYVMLFESIVETCSDILEWSGAPEPSPSIMIKPAERRMIIANGTAVLRRANSYRSYHVALKIPKRVRNKICTLTGRRRDEELPYMLLSSGEFKTLRVFFPKKGRDKKVIHIGFQHLDAPGALAAVTEVLAESDFSILTSLLRQSSGRGSDESEADLNILEAVLEHQPEAEGQYGALSTMRDVAEILERNLDLDLADQMKRFDVTVLPPMYPKRKRVRQESGPLGPLGIVSRLFQRSAGVPNVIPLGRRSRQEYQEQSRRLVRRGLASGIETSPEATSVNAELFQMERQQLRTLVSRRVREDQRPVIFYSYPSDALRHADLIKSHLDVSFESDEYQKPDLRYISRQVVSKISECNFFVGIWHHEQRGAGEFGVSPWMPFELGVAQALGKPSAVIYSEKLPESIWKRIDPGIARPAYADITFDRDTVPSLVAYCLDEWAVK